MESFDKKKSKDKVTVVQQQHQKQEIKLSKILHVHPGHTLFEVNTETNEIRKAEFNDDLGVYKFRWDWKPGGELHQA